MPARLRVAVGTVADCIRAEALIDYLAAACLLADKEYDTNKVLAAAQEHEMTPQIDQSGPLSLWAKII